MRCRQARSDDDTVGGCQAGSFKVERVAEHSAEAAQVMTPAKGGQRAVT